MSGIRPPASSLVQASSTLQSLPASLFSDLFLPFPERAHSPPAAPAPPRQSPRIRPESCGPAPSMAFRVCPSPYTSQAAVNLPSPSSCSGAAKPGKLNMAYLWKFLWLIFVHPVQYLENLYTSCPLYILAYYDFSLQLNSIFPTVLKHTLI